MSINDFYDERCSECHNLLLDDEKADGICKPCDDLLHDKWFEDPDMEDQ